MLRSAFKQIMRKFKKGTPSRRRETNTGRLLYVFGPPPFETYINPRLKHLKRIPGVQQVMKDGDRFVKAARGWSILKMLETEKIPPQASLPECLLIQECILQLSLINLFKTWRMHPTAAVGLSIGEIAAAYAVGSITLDDTFRICLAWGDMLQRGTPGKFVVTYKKREQVKSLWQQLAEDVPIALQGLNTNVWAVPNDRWSDVEKILTLNKIEHQVFDVGFLFHSPPVATVTGGTDLDRVSGQSLASSLYSSVSKGKTEQALSPTDWRKLIWQPIDIAGLMKTALREPYDAVLFLGSSLGWDHDFQNLIRQTAQPGPYLPTFARGWERSLFMMETMTLLQEQGYALPFWLFGQNSQASSNNGSTTNGVNSRPGHSHEANETPPPPRDIPAGIPCIQNLETEEIMQNLHSYYHTWRQIGPIHYLEDQRGWLLLNYDDIASVLKRSDVFSNAPYQSFNKLLSGADGPEHKRVRHILAPFFSRQRVIALSGLIEQHTRQAMDKLKRQESFDLIQDLTGPLPQAILCDFLGVDPDQIEHLQVELYTNSTWSALSPALTGHGLLQEIIDDGQLNEAQMLDLTRFLLGAGVLTLHDFLGMAVYTLLGQPDWLSRVRAEPDLIPDITEELLRLEPPVLTLQRQVKQQTVLSGIELQAGEIVYLAIGAANRDPKHYEQPDELILSRSGPRHLSFSLGTHYCLGDRLGRLEAEIILKILLTEMPRLQALQPLTQVTFKEGLHMRGINALPLAWDYTL